MATVKKKPARPMLNPRATTLVELIYKNPKPIDWMLKKLKVSEPKTVYRYLHQLHEANYDVCRRGFEHFGDIVYSVDSMPKGQRAPRRKKS